MDAPSPRARPVTLQRLQVFCAVHERGSISAAARALGLSQPTASRHLRDLEAALGLPLFAVDRGRVAPTPEADTIYEETRFLQEGLGRLEARIEGLRHGAGGRLSVICVGFLVPHHLPRAIEAVRQAMPRLRLDVDVGTAAEQLRAIEAGRVEIGVVAGPAPSSELSHRVVGSGRLVALVPREHPLAGAHRVDIETLAHAQPIRLTPHGPVGRLLSEALAARGLSLDPGVTARSLLAAAPLAQTLRRPVIVDEFTAQTAASGGMVRLDLDPELRFDLAVISTGPPSRSAAGALFASAMRDALSPDP